LRRAPAAGGRLWRTEFFATLLLGLAAVGAGWSAYQAARWSGNETLALDQANDVRREAALVQTRAYLIRVIHVGLFTQYLQAVSQHNTTLTNLLFERFPPPLKFAIKAWLATKPLKNPNAPPTPFSMHEYQIPEDAEARRLEEEARKIGSEARHDGETSENYILVTVPFAIVSLFSGLSTKFATPGIRTAIVAMAFIVSLVAAIALAFMPVS
jgi:hypothetical protein